MKGRGFGVIALVASIVPVMIVAELLVLFLFCRSGANGAVPGSTTQITRSANGPIRVVLMSDTHIIGPQYVPGSESNPVDNDSILKTVQRLAAVRDTVNALVPQPEFAVFVGDVVHNALDASKDFDYFLKTPTGLSIAADLFDGFRVPLHYLWGNHDYLVTCGDPGASISQSVNHKLLDAFFKTAPYHAMDVGSWKLVFLNSMLGPTWDPNHEMCNTKLSSYGEDQLSWLAAQLQEDKPTILFLHFPPPTAVRDEAPGSEWPDLLSVFLAFENIQQVYTGHYHRGAEWSSLYPFPVTTLPAIRYDSDNFFILDLAQDGSEHRLIDWAKNKGGARCSDTWVYVANGTATPRLDSEETGTCGDPLAEATESFTLPPVHHLDDIPGSFNPDKSCAVSLARQVLQSCLVEDRDMGSCCEIMKEAFKPSSAAYFASCMCQPAFWQAMEQSFDEVGLNIRETAMTCVEEYGALLQFLGQAHGSCPLPGAAASVV